MSWLVSARVSSGHQTVGRTGSPRRSATASRTGVPSRLDQASSDQEPIRARSAWMSRM